MGIYVTSQALLSVQQPRKEKSYMIRNKESESVCRSIIFDSAIPWIVTHQAPLSMKFSRQEY